MEISIVIPTRDRPAALRRLMLTLGDDRAEPELIVVDDGSHDRRAVAAAAGGARVLRTVRRGPAAARNLGAREATGAIVCFIDDDCEPAPQWARTLAEAAARSGAAAGRTLAPAGAGASVAASQAIVEHLTLSSLDSATGRLGFAPTCNLAVAREALRRLPFDESFAMAAGEDRDWSARAAVAGIGAEYVPEAIVFHHQRLGAAEFARQQLRYGRGAARFRAAGGRRRVAAPSFYAGLVRRGFAGGAAVGGLVLAAQAITAAGVAAERFARLGRERG